VMLNQHDVYGKRAKSWRETEPVLGKKFILVRKINKAAASRFRGPACYSTSLRWHPEIHSDGKTIRGTGIPLKKKYTPLKLHAQSSTARKITLELLTLKTLLSRRMMKISSPGRQ